MIGHIERLLTDLEHGGLSRRQFAASVAAVAAAALPGVSVLQAAAQPTGCKATSINHVTLRVPNLHKTSQFYQEFFGMPLRQQSATVHILGVGSSFFGIERGDANQKPSVDHYDFGIADFNADALRAKLKERGLSYNGSNSQESFKFHDADGFQVQVNGPDYVGHVSWPEKEPAPSSLRRGERQDLHGH